MRIVHCFFTFEIGGAQVLAVDLLNKMCNSHDTSLIVVNNICSEALLQKLDKRVTIYRINRKEGSRNPLPLVKLNLLLVRLRPDIIHCHEPDIGRIMKVKVGKKVYTIHDTGIPTSFYHHFDSLVAISDAVHNELAHRFNRPIQTIYNGIDTTAFKQRRTYDLNNEKIRVVQLSRLMHEKKGQDLLLQALKQVKDQYNYANFTVDFIGSGASFDYLKNLTNSLQLNDHIRFLGDQNRDWLYENLASYHLLVQPSRYEGFGLTILEGFAAGLPALASNIEGPAEIVSHTPRGFLFEKENSNDCADKLYQIFQNYENGTLKNTMQQSVPITETAYSINACVEGYLNAYKALIK